MRARDIERIKREIGKIGVTGVRMTREEAAASGRTLGRARLADERDARPGHRIGVGAGRVDEQAGARITREVLRMQRQLGNQEQRASVGLRGGEQ